MIRGRKNPQRSGCTYGAFAILCVLAQPLAAQNDIVRAPSDNPLRELSRGLKMRHEPAPAPDWVVKTRKPEHETTFVPTGAAARTEPAPLMKLDRLKQLEQELDNERARHDRLSPRAAAPKARRTVAIGPNPKKKAAPRPCVLTCATPIGSARKR